MVRIAVVEDDESYQGELYRFLQRYEQENGIKFHITSYSDGVQIAENYTGDYDVILMDIEMKEMDGMTAAEKIRERDGQVILIFITNAPQYAMKGYTVDALDYLLKPLTYFSFSQRLNRAFVRLNARRHTCLTIPYHNGLVKLDAGKITYVEVMDHDLVYHTVSDTYRTKGSLSEVAVKLEGEAFFRISNCYLINLEHVDSVQGNDVEIGGKYLTVSRSKRKELLYAINDYLSRTEA